MRPNHWFGVGVVVLALGALAPRVEAKGSVRVTFTTAPVPGQYQPNNVVAAWIQNGAGQHVRTVGLWSAVRTQYLIAYRQAATANDPLAPDAVSEASRLNHAMPLTVIWNLKDKAGAVVPDGTYTIRLELADSNSSSTATNNEGTFTFVKGPSAQTQTGVASGKFTNVTIAFDPQAIVCGDGVADPPETCDFNLTGSCIVNQSGCPGVADKCMPQVFQGDKLQCSADCVVQPITACVDGDLCCPAGCDEASDSDCVAGGGGGGGGEGGTGDDNVSGGCATGSEGGVAVFALFGIFVLSRRRRR